MPSMVEVKCKCCGKPFKARVADRKRGWGKFCSKRCKAIKQEQRTGQYARYRERQEGRDEFGEHDGFFSMHESGPFGHGQD